MTSTENESTAVAENDSDATATGPTKDDATASNSSDSEISAIKKMLLESKVDGKKSLWATTLETFGMADGKHHRNDILVDTVEEGCELLNAYVEAQQATQEEEEQSRNNSNKMNPMDLVPLKEFQASQNQFLTAFLRWAETEDPKTKTTKINVDKARRRLDQYFQWMTNNRKDLEEPLTIESIGAAAALWGIQITYEEEGKFVWWIDLGSLDQEKMKELAPRDFLRYVVWFSHLVMFDSKAQENGAMLVENMGHIGFWKLSSLVPHELSAKLDRLTIGILPVKMKRIYIFGAANWMSILIALMKPFMGKKMRQRMVIVPKKTNLQEFCDNLVTRKNIPQGFCGLEGESKRDAVLDKFREK